MLSRFSLKDIIFLALLAVVLLLITGLIMPLVMFTQLFALRQLFSAPFFALFSTVALMKTPKPGALTLIGFFTGSVLLFMSPIMFFNNVLGALVAELIVLLLFKGYPHRLAIGVATSLFVPLTLPITLLATWVMRGESIRAQLGNPWQSLVIVAGCILLSVGGSLLGIRLGDELKKAGRLS